MFQCIVGSQMLTNLCYRKVKYISLYILNFLSNGLIIKWFKNYQIWWYIQLCIKDCIKGDVHIITSSSI